MQLYEDLMQTYGNNNNKKGSLEAPLELHFGTRVTCCGCSLPGLAEFTSYHCEGTLESPSICQLTDNSGIIAYAG